MSLYSSGETLPHELPDTYTFEISWVCLCTCQGHKLPEALWGMFPRDGGCATVM